MSFLFGQQKTLDTSPTDIRALRSQIGDFLMGQLGALGGGPDQPFRANVLDPLNKSYQDNLKYGLAQAKESAGSLTGSGLAENLGQVVSRGNAQQESLLAQLMNQHYNTILSSILGYGTAGVGPAQNAYQPGFLDYLFQGAGQAAPLITALK